MRGPGPAVLCNLLVGPRAAFNLHVTSLNPAVVRPRLCRAMWDMSSAASSYCCCRAAAAVAAAVLLLQLLVGLSRCGFYPGRDFLQVHSQAMARLRKQLTAADRERLTRCYARLAAAAPAMAAEARRQAELRSSRTAVVIGDSR